MWVGGAGLVWVLMGRAGSQGMGLSWAEPDPSPPADPGAADPKLPASDHPLLEHPEPHRTTEPGQAELPGGLRVGSEGHHG